MNKLSLPNELTNDGYFCAYTLRYFINEHLIKTNASSKDDLKVKHEENINLALLMINRAINQGCYHYKYNQNESIFLKACKELYLEIIRHNNKWNPENPNCEYFRVQNEIALGERKKSFNYSEDPNIDKNLYSKMKDQYDSVKRVNEYKILKSQVYTGLKIYGFTDEQIDELINISLNQPELTQQKMKEFIEYNSKNVKINLEPDENDDRIDVDSFLKELGLQ